MTIGLAADNELLFLHFQSSCETWLWCK